MNWKTLDDMAFAGKTALVRVDINVPMEDGEVSDATRINAVLPTIHDISAAGGKVVLLAHFGRPKGKVVPEMSLRHVVPALQEALGREVTFIERPAREAIDALPADAVILVENTRFSPMEPANDPQMAKFLASLGDIYVNDAFSAAHRAHASTEGIAHLLPNCAGRLMAAELTALEAALGTPKRPVVAVVGGAKVSSKLELLGNLVRQVDHLVIGGGMANTFLAAQGKPVGTSLCEHDLAETAREILGKAEAAGCKIHLPVDLVVAREFKANAPHEVVDTCPDDAMILDAGPKTVAALTEVFKACKTLIWNGPLGAFELEPFDAATNAAASAAADLTKAGALVSVAGGGDTVAALNRAGAAQDFSYISTAGGAFLEWMEGKPLPGVQALEAK
ncbi:phosphoglycerate kinase [Pararhodobacter oceanensis]|uniref:Phosphoglycerate kinase n=1 Tax=Pararhodobacter oceanensis TaxID=2172121 RepID=A0A2T8HXP1_9RHOB|nr:phosphoglycerate kinase [Pararhodobacter oceanensis]PVH30183.1 phosphoglycerate kinase [Pararhodobacter oceanensis]